MGIFDFFKKETKSVPPIDSIGETTRDGLVKAYIPKFLYKPPFGYPRFVDIVTIRRLASMPYVEMCISTIIDEAVSVPYEIVPVEGKETLQTEEHIKEVQNFFENPNTNKESFEAIRRKYLRDVLEIDSGVINKIFNRSGQMVEIVARDGGGFTKNPDIYGMYTDREDLILGQQIAPERKKDPIGIGSPPGFITSADAREKAAYFQYGWISGARPIPFGKRELVWFEKNVRTDDLYGRSPVQNLADTIQTLIYSIEHNLSYFNDNSIPKGVLGLEGSNADDIQAFKEQWTEQQRVKDSAGNWKKVFHKFPIVGKVPTFTRFQLTNAELELLEGQRWWAKMVWASFGVTSVELGYTEDSKGLANQIVQSNVFKKRSINPLLRMEEYRINKEIISEFEYDDVKFKFLLFDVEEETKKAALYQMQLNAGYRSINEIRKEEGLEEVDWGEKKSEEERLAMQQELTSNPQSSISKEETDQKKKVSKEKEILSGKKPIKEDIKSVISNPLIMGPGETMNEERLTKSIFYVLKTNEKLVQDLIEKEFGSNKVSEIKSIDPIEKKLKDLISFDGLEPVTKEVIKNLFNSGWDRAERRLNENIMFNQDAVNFIQNYTFNNIKGMTEALVNDLRQTIERGIMNNESIPKIKARIKKVFDVGEVRAEAIARTESTRAENQGELLAFKSSGEDLVKRWDTHFDDRTSDICKRLHGQTVRLNENFKDVQTGWEGQAPPSHVNCRSSVLYLTPKEAEKKALEKEELELKEKEKKRIDEELELALKQKEADIKARKESLLKKLESDLNERDKTLY